MRERFLGEGRPYFDIGTDYHYPFFAEYRPTVAALETFTKHPETLRHYPSSYGLVELREETVRFLKHLYGVDLDAHSEIMVTTGASQAFDALSRGLGGSRVLVPELSLPTVRTIATGNGATVEILANGPDGFPTLDTVDRALRRGSPTKFVYLNSPCNPTGAIADGGYLGDLAELCGSYRTRLVHDCDSFLTAHDIESIASVLETDRWRGNAVTLLSVSKEFGLPGARIGLVAGDATTIGVIRQHNSLFCVMLPEASQLAVSAALHEFRMMAAGRSPSYGITELVGVAIDGWRSLGWPRSALYPPRGGYKFLLDVPPRVSGSAQWSAAELVDYFVVSRAGVKLSTSRSFRPNDVRFLRMVLMLDVERMTMMFDALRDAGIAYQMELPPDVIDEYAAFASVVFLGGPRVGIF